MAEKDVTVTVPEDRVNDFYRWFGEWLAKTDGKVWVPEGAVLPPDGWSSADEATARDILKVAGLAIRELVAILIGGDGRQVSWRELAGPCGVDSRQAVAQLAAALLVACAAKQVRGPLRWVDAGDGPVYWIHRDDVLTWREGLKPPPRPDPVQKAAANKTAAEKDAAEATVS